MPEIERKNVKVICLSCDPLKEHRAWAKDILHVAGRQGDQLPFPIIADPGGRLAVQLGILDEDEVDRQGNLLPCRAVIVIGPGRIIKLLQLYPATTGRNFKEILRVIDSLQLTENKLVCTPANWEPGDPCIVSHKLPLDEAQEKFPTMQVKDLPSTEKYLRQVDYEACVPTKESEDAQKNKRATTLHKPYRTNMF